MASEEQLEELEALHSIYDEDITELSTHPPCFMIKLSNIAQNLKGSISIKISLPVEYPSVVPKIELPMRSKLISKENQQYLLQHLNNVAGESVGMAMVFTLVDSAEQWINDNVTNEDEDEPEIQEEASAQVDITPVNLKEPKVTGGRWEYVIGLVGKPSAGKSTFFNAATSLDLARTGAHPFTTIEPNIGKAFYSIPCPCQKLSQRCHAAYGHNFSGQRHIPVLLKDVAGLVPGAWEGKGRGNRFLNDLLDADVLIHIIDVSGKTNEKGEETEDYDPRNDIQWLRDELHLWIYQNVFSKWDNIVKRPSKLIDMFTGYHANRATIFTALSNAGISDRGLSTVSTWDKSVLHKIVDNFLQVRFPMMLVLNKADLDTSFSNTEKLSADIDNVIAVSARSECLLQKLSKEGIIGYEHGGTEFHIISDLSINDPIRQQLQDIENVVLKRYGSTNVHEALCHAVRLRQPVYAFPVHCLDTLQSIGKPHSGGQVVLKDCISLKPGTTVEELYIAMCHYPVNLINGDFVRAETLKEDGKKRPMRKDEEIGERSCILKIMTTKRTS